MLTLRWPLPILEPKGAHMDDILTMDQIRFHCDVEWVLVEDPELTPELKVVRGNILDLKGSVKPRKRPEDFDAVRRSVKRTISGKTARNE